MAHSAVIGNNLNKCDIAVLLRSSQQLIKGHNDNLLYFSQIAFFSLIFSGLFFFLF